MKGIAIKTANGFLDLPGNAKVSIEENSPFFDRESLRSTFSSPLKLPWTPGNQDKLGSPELIEGNDVNLTGVEGELMSDGVRIQNGFVKINDVQSDLNKRTGHYNVNLLNDNGAYADAVEGKTLRDLLMCGVIPIPGDDILDITDLSGDNIRGEKTNDFATDVILNGHDYFTFPSIRTAPDPHYRIANLWDDAAQKFKIVDVAVQGTVEFILPRSVLIPMFYYHQVIRHCFLDYGYTIAAGGLLDDLYFKKHFLANNYSILKQRIIELQLSAGGPYDSAMQYTELPTEINPANHLWDMPILEFLNDFMIKFGVAFDIKGKRVYVRQIGRNPKMKRSDQHPRYSRELLKPEAVTLKYAYTDDDKEFFSDNVPDYVEGIDQEFVCPVKPIWHWAETNYNGSAVWLADIRYGIQKTGIEHFVMLGGVPFPLPFTPDDAFMQFYDPPLYANTDELFTELPPMIGIYHGLLSNASAYEFPYAARDNRRRNLTNDVIGDWGLYWHSDSDAYGLVDVFLRAWLQIFASKVKDTFYFNEDYIEYLNNQWGTFQIIRNQEYYIAKRKLELPAKSEIIKVVYECYKIS